MKSPAAAAPRFDLFGADFASEEARHAVLSSRSPSPPSWKQPRERDSYMYKEESLAESTEHNVIISFEAEG